MTEGGPRARVIVVGGGLAGLMAARTLSGYHRVTLLEARGEAGGRVRSRTDPTSRRVLEEGAELIGYAHPTWLMLARQFGLGLSVWTTENDFGALRLDMPLELGGELLSTHQAEQVYTDMNDALEKMARAARHSIRDPFRPWAGEEARELDAIPLSDWIAKHGGNERTRLALEVEFANTNAAPSSHQSYLANLALFAGAAHFGEIDDFLTKSENVRCAQGNQELARRLTRSIEADGSKVRCSCPVTRIEIVSSEVHVTTEAAECLDADFVVLAIPPSLWPNSNSDIQVLPEIPAGYYMTMGSAVKYLSPCAERFWIREGRAPYGSSDRFGMIWEGTDNQMQASGQDVELSVFAGGNAALEALAAFGNGHEAAIRTFYDGKISALYPTYAEHRSADSRFVAWPKERWTMSGYSCPAPGDVCGVGPKLQEPYHDRLYFAGEHVCLPFFGYMEGALQSGLRAAESILRATT